MEKEVSLYHQLVEHPIIVFLVGSLLLMLLVIPFGIWWHRRDRRREEGAMKPRVRIKSSNKDTKPVI